MTNIDQGGVALPCTSVNWKDESLAVSGAFGTAKYSGKRFKGGDIEGEFEQKGLKFPLKVASSGQIAHRQPIATSRQTVPLSQQRSHLQKRKGKRHLFRNAHLVNEYGLIEETFAPEILGLMSQWVLDHHSLTLVGPTPKGASRHLLKPFGNLRKTLLTGRQKNR